MNSLQSIIECGSKVWLDSVDPDQLADNVEWGITGATSNPVIISDLIKTGKFDKALSAFLRDETDDAAVAWRMTDAIVQQAQARFRKTWADTNANDGYVSFELDPLLEDPHQDIALEQRVAKYIELGKKWSAGHENRMIKIPNTPAGIRALPDIVAAGVPVNVTLTFTPQQYIDARDAVWQGAKRLTSLNRFKSVYSIFVSRVDVYTAKHVPSLSDEAQGQFGIVNAKQIRQRHREFWSSNQTPLEQEIIFASTGPKLKGDEAWKYVEAFVGGEILTNPPEVNLAVAGSGKTFTNRIDELPSQTVLDEMKKKIDINELEKVLMKEGIKKFADPQKDLLALIAQKREKLRATTMSNT